MLKNTTMCPILLIDPGVPPGCVRTESFGEQGESEGDQKGHRDLRRRVGVDEHYHAGKQNPPEALDHLVVEHRRLAVPIGWRSI